MSATVEDEFLVDALPYIDPDFDANVVQALIDEEIRASQLERPTAESIPEIELFEDRPALKELLAQAAAGIKMKAIDISRLQLPLPQDDSPQHVWDAAINNALAQLEHQNQRIVNLELIAKFGANAWLIHNYQMEAAIKSIKKQIDDVQAEIDSVNKARKTDQMRAKPALAALAQRWSELVYSVLAVRYENDKMDLLLESSQSQEQRQQ